MNIERHITGFMTRKGKLIRAILFLKPINFDSTPIMTRINRVHRPRQLYQRIEKELKSKLDWPEIYDKDFNGKIKYKQHLRIIRTKQAIYKIIFMQNLNKNHRK